MTVYYRKPFWAVSTLDENDVYEVFLILRDLGTTGTISGDLKLYNFGITISDDKFVNMIFLDNHSKFNQDFHKLKEKYCPDNGWRNLPLEYLDLTEEVKVRIDAEAIISILKG